MIFRFVFFLFFFTEITSAYFFASAFGFLTLVMAWIAGCITGAVLIRKEGIGMLANVQNALSLRAVPVDDVFDSVCVVIAGMLLMLPGFVSDVIALCLVVPRLRHVLRSKMPMASTRTPGSAPPPSDVIDGTYVRVNEPVDDVLEHADKHDPRIGNP